MAQDRLTSLSLTRRVGQSIVIVVPGLDLPIVITPAEISGNEVMLRFNAPICVEVMREEIPEAASIISRLEHDGQL